MLQDLRLSLSELYARIGNVWRLGSYHGISLRAFNASYLPDLRPKYFFMAEFNSGYSIQNVNHLRPVMVLIKSNRL
jgi:hypothetical protein